MESYPKVSVIIPTFNRAELLPRAIRSVLNQDFADIEIIVIDDGSTDETPQIVAQFSDLRIRYIRFEQNRGIGFGRNQGVCRSNGKVIAFIDADDVWLPGKLSLQVSLFEKYHQIEILFGNFWNINHMIGEKALGFNQAATAFSHIAVKSLEQDVYQILSGFLQAMLQQNFISPSTVVIRKELFKRIGNFSCELSGPEDFEFWWRAAVKNACYAYIEQPLIERNKDDKSITSMALKFAPMKLKALEMCEQIALTENKRDLIPQLNKVRARTWRSLIRANALSRKRMAALRAFINSARYGLSPEALLYIMAAITGPKAIALVKKILNGER